MLGTPFQLHLFFFYILYFLSQVPAKSSVEVEASVERAHRDLTLITSPIKVFENSPIEGIKCKEDITPVSGDTTKVTIKNTEQGIVVPRRTPVGIGELATMQENILQEMSKALELNRKQRISALEGVTHGSGEYWEATNKIDLDHSKLSPKSREQLFDIIFEQRGAMSLCGQIGKLKNFYYKIKMSSDKICVMGHGPSVPACGLWDSGELRLPLKGIVLSLALTSGAVPSISTRL